MLLHGSRQPRSWLTCNVRQNMNAKISPQDAITGICARIAEIEEFNRRSDACLRMRDLKEKGRSFEFISGTAFAELPVAERQRLERARPLIARVMKRLRERVYGIALAGDLGEHYRKCSGLEAHDPELPAPKKTPQEYHTTTLDSQSVWKFLQGGAPGLIQQK